MFQHPNDPIRRQQYTIYTQYNTHSILYITHKTLISDTSRPKQDGEIDGVDYHFTSRAQFESMVAKNMVSIIMRLVKFIGLVVPGVNPVWDV